MAIGQHKQSDHLIMLLRKVEAVLKADNNLIHSMLKDMFNMYLQGEDKCIHGMFKSK